MSIMGITIMTTVRKMMIMMIEEIRVNSSLIFREFTNCTVLVTSIFSPFQQVPNKSSASVRVYRVFHDFRA